VLVARIGTAIVVVAVLLGIARTRGHRVDLLLMTWPTIGLFGLMTLQSGLKFHHTYYVSGISGRYLFAGLAALAVAAGAGAAATGPLARVMPLLTLAAAGAIQAEAVRILFPRYWQGPGDGLRGGWEAMTAWSPWPPRAVEGAAGLGALLLACVFVWTVVAAVRRPPADDTAPDAPTGGGGGDARRGGIGSVPRSRSHTAPGAGARPDPAAEVGARAAGTGDDEGWDEGGLTPLGGPPGLPGGGGAGDGGAGDGDRTQPGQPVRRAGGAHRRPAASR
jgi:small subunit ribosomal protein S36